MAVTAVVGAQWGDEGKGRIVDWLGQRADMVIRFQGGDNAGHTVINSYGTFKLHMVPSGIFNPETICIVGTGCVVNLDGLQQELTQVQEAGVDTANLWLSNRAHVVMPYHLRLDGLQERARAEGRRIGTTKRGIGPAYTDKAARRGIRLGDLLRPDSLRERLQRAIDHANAQFARFDEPEVELDAMVALCTTWAERFGAQIIDTVPLVRDVVRADKNVLLEGQLGIMRDLDWGIYPYVTSSNPSSAYAAVGAGLPPTAISAVVGVVKAYSTSVGGGPFPCELLDDVGERLREAGQEYGATTGRPRRCGWFDGVAVAYSAWLNGFTGLAITKLDVLDDFNEILVCTGYKLDGEVITNLPDTPDQARCEPIYETWPGWCESTEGARHWHDLPLRARRFLRRISALAGVPIDFVSVGAERHSLIVVEATEQGAS